MSRPVTFRLQDGSALERYLNNSDAKNATAKLHELAAKYEMAKLALEKLPSGAGK